MDKSLRYTQVMPNFDSAYNTPSNRIPQSIIYIPMSSSANFSTFSNRSSSPLFHRSISPPPRPTLPTGRVPKFNFDLYKMDENNNEYDDYLSPTYRSISPSSSRIIHHYPIYSPSSSSTSKSQSLSKLRQINDELCQTLARSELTDPLPPPPHYHIHHYPLSQHSRRKYRSRSTSEERSPSYKLEVPPKIHKARVTYKIHIPQRYLQKEQQHRKSSRHLSPSDAYSSDDSTTVDLYPTRDQGFVKQIRKHSDNQSPWIVDGTSIRRNSYSDTSTSRPPQTPKGPHYGDKPIKSNRRSTRENERPLSKTSERVWHPPSKTISKRPPKYFEPTLKPEYDVSTGKYDNDGTESEPVSQQKTLSNRTKIRTSDPKLKKRIVNTESKVKSAWEPSITGLIQSTVKESKSPTPLPVKQTTTSTPPKSKVKSVPSEPTAPTKKVVTASPTMNNTGRSSLNNEPIKPVFESTPRNENNDSVDDLFENELHTSEQSKKQELPHPPPPIEKTPTPQQPRKSATELPKTAVPEPDKDTKSTIKDGVLIFGNDTKNIRNQNPTSSPKSEVNSDDNDNNEEASNTQNGQPIPPPKFPINHRKTPPPKPNNESVNDDDEDENDQEVAHSFDINKWLSDASKAILGPSKQNDLVIPSTPPLPQPPETKSNAKSPPGRREQSLTPSDDENLYKPPFGPKKKDKKPSSSPPPLPATITGKTDEVDDFFS